MFRCRYEIRSNFLARRLSRGRSDAALDDLPPSPDKAIARSEQVLFARCINI